MFEDRLDTERSDTSEDDLLDAPNIEAPERTDDGWFAKMKDWF